MNSGSDDRQLIERIAEGDEGALKALIDRHHVAIHRFALRRLRNEALAEEVCHETFLDAWRTARSYEGRSRPSTWLLAIAHNKAVSLLRKRREVEWDEKTAGALVDDSDDPEIALQKADKRTLLRALLSRLSAEHRTIIDLVYYHERSVAEASEILGVPEGTVKTRMFHARKRLSELMRQAGIDRGWP